MLISIPERESVGDRSRRLWSLWDMLRFKAGPFVTLILDHRGYLMANQGSHGPLSAKDQQSIKEYSERFQGLCQKLGLITTKGVAEHIGNATTVESLLASCDSAERALHAELSGRYFYELDQKYEEYYQANDLFGPDVSTKFPAANEDIYEAGNCLAFEEGTACVFHLMRALELGLAAFATKLGATITDDMDWGKILAALDEEIKKLPNKTSAEQAWRNELSEVRSNLWHVKQAWRHPMAHAVKKQTYTPEQARQVFEAVKAFMSHLASIS